MISSCMRWMQLRCQAVGTCTMSPGMTLRKVFAGTRFMMRRNRQRGSEELTCSPFGKCRLASVLPDLLLTDKYGKIALHEKADQRRELP